MHLITKIDIAFKLLYKEYNEHLSPNKRVKPANLHPKGKD